MARKTLTPLRSMAYGLAAGAVGTVAMDLLWYWRYRRGGGESNVVQWEFNIAPESWEKAPMPAQVGKRLYDGFLQRNLPLDRASLTNNIVHWGYGMTWAALYSLVAGSVGVPRVLAGVPFGAFVWTASYTILPLAKLYKPIWEYDTPTLAKDLSAHLTYGFSTAAVFALLADDMDDDDDD